MFDNSDYVNVYWDRDGQVLSCCGRQAKVMDLLGKLGIKSVPTLNCTMWSTHVTVPPGNYQVSYTRAGTVISIDVSIPVSSATSFIIPEIKLEEPVKRKGCKPTKDTRRQWRQQQKMHSRNTGRTIGRR